MCVLTFIPSYVVAAVLSVLPLAGRTSSDGERPWPWPLAPVATLVERFDAPDSDYGPGHRGIDLRPGQKGRDVIRPLLHPQSNDESNDAQTDDDRAPE